MGYKRISLIFKHLQLSKLYLARVMDWTYLYTKLGHTSPAYYKLYIPNRINTGELFCTSEWPVINISHQACIYRRLLPKCNKHKVTSGHSSQLFDHHPLQQTDIAHIRLTDLLLGNTDHITIVAIYTLKMIVIYVKHR